MFVCLPFRWQTQMSFKCTTKCFYSPELKNPDEAFIIRQRRKIHTLGWLWQWYTVMRLTQRTSINDVSLESRRLGGIFFCLPFRWQTKMIFKWATQWLFSYSPELINPNEAFIIRQIREIHTTGWCWQCCKMIVPTQRT